MYGAGEELTGLLRQERVTHAVLTPSALASMHSADLDELQVVVVGGEACPPELVEQWAPGRKFFNGYGPTETTIVSTISEPLQPGEPVTIGSPVRGESVFVLDDRLRAVPSGVAGELYVSGHGIARAYHGRSGLTADRFVANPFGEPGERMYRTGDIVRWRAGKTIEYVGRSDAQVKIRGFRIELGEIDAALAGHPDVKFATTAARRLPTGDIALVSHVLPLPGTSFDVDDVERAARRILPAHMVPSTIMVLDEIPLTPVANSIATRCRNRSSRHARIGNRPLLRKKPSRKYSRIFLDATARCRRRLLRPRRELVARSQGRSTVGCSIRCEGSRRDCL